MVEVESLLVKGGAHVLQCFLDSGLYDKLNVEHTPVQLHDGVPAPNVKVVS